ncbi:MAG: hypothetical protein RDV48_19735 [Candidatus Eremiobacteraeota bacterium]|nr:hypothetical protein [Candidatus Eremiobacteraeota bacterium]
MGYEITEMEFSEECNYCKEPMKGFIVFGRHTPKKSGGHVEFNEYVFSKRMEGDAEILSLILTAKCPSCNLKNLWRIEYDIKNNTYKGLDIPS